MLHIYLLSDSVVWKSIHSGTRFFGFELRFNLLMAVLLAICQIEVNIISIFLAFQRVE